MLFCKGNMISLTFIFLVAGCWDVIIASPQQQRDKTTLFLKVWEPCGRNKTSSNDCIKKALQYYIPAILRGDLEELGYEGVDPMFVEEFVFKYDSLPDVGGLLSLRNTTVLGFSNFTITKLMSNVSDSDLSVEIVFSIPQTVVYGDFFISGRAEDYPVTGSGQFNVITGEIGGTMKIDGQVQLRNGKKKITLKKVDIKPTMDYFSINADNLLKGDPQIGWLVITFTSRFSKLVYLKTLPYLLSTVEDFAKSSVERIFSVMPYDQLFSYINSHK